MNQLLLWQLADSAFPSGGFAHSGGLEAAAQQGEVDAGNLEDFLREAIVQAAHGSLPLVAAAHDDPASLPDLDAFCDAWLSNAVANRASRTQGRAFLIACEGAFEASDIQALCASTRAMATPLHYAPLFGAMCSTLGLSRHETLTLFLHLTCRGVLAAAVRLGLTGSNRAQRMQARCAPLVDAEAERCQARRPDDLAQTAPLADLWQSTHDRLYSRLFQS